MTTRRQNRRNRTRTPDRRPADVWRLAPGTDRPATIAPATDATALLRSLGPPPLAGQSDADRYLAAVVEKAAGFATALAAQADLLAPRDLD